MDELFGSSWREIVYDFTDISDWKTGRFRYATDLLFLCESGIKHDPKKCVCCHPTVDVDRACL